MGTSVKESYDVVIAGGGPAGSSLAIRLALVGMSVLVAEQKRFPREKLCGEFISPECLSHFDELGVLTGISSQSSRIAETVFYARSGRSVSIPSKWFATDGASAVGLSRAEMDEKLMRRAAQLGVEVCEGTVVAGITIDGEHVIGVKLRCQEGGETDVAAGLIVDATGRSRAITRFADAHKQPAARARHIAFKTHLTGAGVQSGACEIYSYGGGYGGCNLVEGGKFNLCFIAASQAVRSAGSDPDRVMREIVFDNPRAREVLENAEVVTSWLAVPIQRFGRASLVPRPGLVTVGDSAAFIDPFTGSGILLALESSRVLSDAIERNWQVGIETVALEYQKAYSAAFDPRLRWASRLRYAAFSPVTAELIVAGLGLSAPFRRRVARLTRESTGSV